MSYVKFDSFNTEDNDISVSSLGTFEDAIVFERLKTAHHELLSFDRFSNRQRDVSLVFTNDDGFRKFKKAVLKTEVQTIVFGDDESVEHIGHVTNFQRTQLNETLFEIVVTIELYPFGYLKERTVTLNANGTIENKGDVECEPKIFLKGNGECILTVGDYVCRLNIDEQLTIECDRTKANVYDKNGALANSRMKGDFPKLVTGLNGVALTGITQAEFLLRERVL
ncbi:MAG: hypothetical protein ACRC17_02050 [Culicoidibacterales bacterium]